LKAPLIFSTTLAMALFIAMPVSGAPPTAGKGQQQEVQEPHRVDLLVRVLVRGLGRSTT
jgi:hypothetical protein